MWLLLWLFAVQQAFFAVNQPTRSAVLPADPAAELLPAANSLNMTVFQAGAIGGPLVAGVLIPVVGLEWLYLIDTVTLLRHPRSRCPAAEPAGGRRGHGDPRAARGDRRASPTCATSRCC